GGGAGRAGGRALAASGADLLVDSDMIARRRDGARRTQIEAAAAADDPGTRMGAEIGRERDIARLGEPADEITGAQDGIKHRRAVARIGPDVAVAQIGGRKERRAARHVKQDVATRAGAVPRLSELESAARRRQGQSIVVDGDLEGAEIARRGTDLSLGDRELADPRRRQLLWRSHHDGYVEMLPQPVPGLNRTLVAAIDENDAAAFEMDIRGLRQRLDRGRCERRHLGTGPRRLARPAAGLAQIDKAQAAALARGLTESWRLLCAADRHRYAGRGELAEPVELGTAELAAADDVRCGAAARHRSHVERHRAIAAANQDRVPVRHRLSIERADSQPDTRAARDYTAPTASGVRLASGMSGTQRTGQIGRRLDLPPPYR